MEDKIIFTRLELLIYYTVIRYCSLSDWQIVKLLNLKLGDVKNVLESLMLKGVLERVKDEYIVNKPEIVK